MRILAANQGIETARRLGEALGCPVIRNSTWNGRSEGPVFNWGVARPKGETYNYMARNAGDKIATIGLLQKAGIATVVPRYPPVGRPNPYPRTLVARDTAHGFEGAGITLVEPGQVVPPYVYCTEHYPNIYEFRVHVVGERVLCKARKVRRNGGDADMRIRAGQDFVWQLENLPIGGNRQPTHAQLNAIAIAAIRALFLDYGVVDILFNATRNEVIVCEVNSAPELLGTRVDVWAEALRALA